MRGLWKRWTALVLLMVMLTPCAMMEEASTVSAAMGHEEPVITEEETIEAPVPEQGQELGVDGPAVVETPVEESSNMPAEDATATVIKLTNSTSYTADVGQTLALDLGGKKAKSYKSSNTKVATVDQGTVQVLKAGKAKITVTLTNKKKLVLTLNVKEGKITGLDFVCGKRLTMQKGDSVKMYAEASTKRGAVDAALTWSSSKKSVATVSQSGVIKAKKPGKTKITVKAPNGKKASITVEVIEEFKAVNWSDVVDIIDDMGIEGSFRTIKKAGIRLWLPKAMKSKKLSAEEKGSNIIAIYRFEDGTGGVGLSHLSLKGLTAEALVSILSEENAKNVSVEIINGNKAVTYYLPESDTLNVTIVSEEGNALIVTMGPFSEKDAKYLWASISASINVI